MCLSNLLTIPVLLEICFNFFNKPLTFLEHIENLNTFNRFLKADSELTEDDD